MWYVTGPLNWYPAACSISHFNLGTTVIHVIFILWCRRWIFAIDTNRICGVRVKNFWVPPIFQQGLKLWGFGTQKVNWKTLYITVMDTIRRFILLQWMLQADMNTNARSQSWENPRAARARSRNTKGPTQEHSSPETTYNSPLYCQRGKRTNIWHHNESDRNKVNLYKGKAQEQTQITSNHWDLYYCHKPRPNSN